MPNPRLASRYAKSLVDLSIEKGQLEEVFADMQWLEAVVKASPDFVTILRSPVIKSDKKQKIVEAVVTGKVSAITAGFTRLLITKGRESNLPEIVTSFVSQYKAHKNIYIVKLTTASPVDEKLKSEIIEQVRKTSDMYNIELQTSVNEALIGGFVLQAGDKLVDASIAYDLHEIARQFENNDFIYKVR